MIDMICGYYDMRYKLANFDFKSIGNNIWPTLLKEEAKILLISINQAKENNF